MTPEVSVIMAAHDVADVVDDAIAAIVAQQGVTWELLVVDDGSRDATAQRLASWVAELGSPRMRVLATGRRGGAGQARNIAIAQARGEFLAIADADDISLPDRLATSVAALRDQPAAAAVGGQVAHFWKGHAPRQTWSFPVDPDAVRATVRDGRMPVAHPATTFRADSVRTMGGYDESLLRAQDLDLVLRLARHHEVVGLDRVLVHYRRNPRLASPRAFFRNQMYAAYVRERHRRSAAGESMPPVGTWLMQSWRRPAHLGWLGLRYVKQLAVPS